MNPKPTVLLVDDSRNDLFLTRAAFERAEFINPLQTASTGEEAIAYLKGEGPFRDRDKFPLPAVMLLDLNMPMSGGFEVLKWVGEQSGLKRLSVIVLSASTRPEDVEQAFELGASFFLVKPGTMNELMALTRCLRDWLEYNHFPPLNKTARR
jgi:CheY-like chemotaxis protein